MDTTCDRADDARALRRAKQRLYSPWFAVDVIASQLNTAWHVLSGEKVISQNVQEYVKEEAFWNDIISEKVTENTNETLHNFIVSEWLPLRPGVFYTDEARMARGIAFDEGRVDARDPNTPRPLREYLENAEGYSDDLQNETEIVFAPDGKTAMVQGGVGCIRLKPLSPREEFRWLMSACSTKIVHAGIPIKIRDTDHQRIYDDIRKYGGIRCTLSGHLRFILDTEPYAMTYRQGIPQLYLEATSVNPRPSSEQDARNPSVSAVVSFISRSPPHIGLYAAFVTFDAGRHGALKESAEWLQKVYIEESYNGRIVTDFDQQMRRFADASFSLERLLTATTTTREAKDTYKETGLLDWQKKALEGKRKRATIIVEGNYYEVANAGAVGDGASAGTVHLTR
jgi:hypothetical protein